MDEKRFSARIHALVAQVPREYRHLLSSCLTFYPSDRLRSAMAVKQAYLAIGSFTRPLARFELKCEHHVHESFAFLRQKVYSVAIACDLFSPSRDPSDHGRYRWHLPAIIRNIV